MLTLLTKTTHTWRMNVKNEQLRSGLPLIRLSLLTPFTNVLDERGINYEGVFTEFGLSRESLAAPDVFITASVMYRLLEGLARAADDPYLAVHIGEALDLYSWPLFMNAAPRATTFVDFFLRFSMEVGNQATSNTYHLNTDGQHAVFRLQRVVEPELCPGQADAFYVGLFHKLFRHATGELWDPFQIMIRVCDVSAVPPAYNKIPITQGDRLGCSIRFPQQWLLLPFDIENFRHQDSPDTQYIGPPKSLIEAMQQALMPHLHVSNLNAERVAQLCGFDRRVLARKMHAKGTTISREIAHLREVRATELLSLSDHNISEIANQVGFSDPAVFSRAFRKWTGMSPSEYRKKYKSNM